MRHFLFIVVSLLYLNIAHAQYSATIKGTVRDSLGKPVEAATVTLVKKSNGAGALFARTDKDGNYHFTLIEQLQQEQLAVKVSYVGMLRVQKDVTDFQRPIDFSLHPEPQQVLPEVKVKSRVFVVQKSDTISFTADFFRDSTDRVLGDLIKRIPGIQVDDNGAIKYNGKYLNNFYIEGDDLLDGKYNIATDNIPSKDVDKVEVIEHNQHIKMLNGVVPSDEPALNIRLKDKSKLKWINNADLAAGTPSKYSGKVNSMAFKPKIKAINEVDANNIGKDLSNGLVSHYGGDGTASPMLNIDASRPAGIRQNRYLFNKNQLVNINDMYKLRSGSSIRLNAYYLHDEQPFSNNSVTTYYLPSGDTVGYTERQDSRQKMNRVQASLSYITNNDKQYFTETLFADVSSNSNNVATETNGQSIQQYLKSTLNGFSNNLNGVWKIAGKHIVNYSSIIGYTRNPQGFRILPGWQQEIFNSGNDYQQTLQHTNQPSWSTTNSLNSIIKIGEWTFNNVLGFSYSHQKLQSDISLLQNDNSWTVPAGFRNRLVWDNISVSLTPNAMWERDRNRINILVPVSYNYIHYRDTSTVTSDKVNKVFANPNIKYRLLIGKEHELSAGYSYGNSISGIENVYAAGILQNYRSISATRMPLLLGYVNNYNLRFAYKKTLKLFFWNIGTTYATSHSYYIISSTINNQVSQAVALPMGNDGQSWKISTDVSKYLFALKTTLNASVGLGKSKAQQMQNDVLFGVSNWSNNYSLGLSPRLIDWLRIELNADYMTGTSSSRAVGYSDQKTSQWKQTSALNILLFGRLSAQFSSEYYASYLNKQRLAECLFLDTYLNYRFYKPDLELRLSCNNLVNEKNFRVVNASTNVVSSREYQLQPRMLLLSGLFRF